MFAERALVLTRNGDPPVKIDRMRLIVLVNYCLYLVPENAHGLKAGQVLWRDMSLTLRRGGSREDPATHQFKAYYDLNHARRAAALIEPSYRDVEDAKLREWLQTLDWMVRTSWSLHRVGEEEQLNYEWVAEQLAQTHARVRNDHKVQAQRRSAQAGSITDSIGRRNPGRIPLIVFASERQLRKRLHEMRGISRRMSWRQVVLEHYIDSLREITRTISRSAQHRVESPQLFGSARTTGTVRKEADRMQAEAERLRSLVGRPFSRNFNRVADNLDSAAVQMREAAEHLNGQLMGPVADELQMIYRSTKLLEYHWRLEELMVHTSRMAHNGTPDLSPGQQLMWEDELARIHAALVRPDPVTQKLWDTGFRRRMTRRVTSQVQLAKARLMQPDAAGGPDIVQMHEHLKEACSPF